MSKSQMEMVTEHFQHLLDEKFGIFHDVDCEAQDALVVKVTVRGLGGSIWVKFITFLEYRNFEVLSNSILIEYAEPSTKAEQPNA